MSDISWFGGALVLAFFAMVLLLFTIIVIGLIRVMRKPVAPQQDPPSTAPDSAPDVSRDGS